MGALEVHILLGEFVDVDFKRSRFTMKWNESESEVVYSDPAIDMSQSNHLRRREGLVCRIFSKPFEMKDPE